MCKTHCPWSSLHHLCHLQTGCTVYVLISCWIVNKSLHMVLKRSLKSRALWLRAVFVPSLSRTEPALWPAPHPPSQDMLGNTVGTLLWSSRPLWPMIHRTHTFLHAKLTATNILNRSPHHSTLPPSYWRNFQTQRQWHDTVSLCVAALQSVSWSALLS